jgi:Leucine-rich repeat (LRR) protein
MNSNPSWVYFNMLGSCIGGSSYNSQTDTVNISNNLPDSTAIMCLITDSLSSCIVTDTLVYDSLTGWSMNSNQFLALQTYVPDDNFEAFLEVNGMGNGIYNDDSVTTANIDTVTYLYIVNAFSPSIYDLTGIEAFTALTYLNCSYNHLASLDVSNNTALTYLNCSYNQLTQLNLSQNISLNSLDCYNIPLTNLDISNNTNLTELNCRSTQLTSLDLTNNTALTVLNFSYNQLSSINLTNNPALTELRCKQNSLTSLDLSQNPTLTFLNCNTNYLTSLDISNNTTLINFQCSYNQLTSLDLRNGNNTNFLNFQTLNNPFLYCISVDDTAWANTNWTVANFNIDSQHYFNNFCIAGCADSLACNYDSLATIDDGSCTYPVIWYQTPLLCDGDSILVGSSVYDTAGNYIDTLSSANGCDSILNTYLMVEQSTSSYDTLFVGAGIVWNGMSLNVSGDYSGTLVNSAGCDSIVNLNLTVTTTGTLDITSNKSNLVKITDMLGQETPYRRNTPLFYIYNDGTIEKKITIE